MGETLVNMKLTKADRDARTEPKAIASDEPAYPWGLSLTLDDKAIEKLGLKLPKVGGSLLLEARVDVTAVSSNESTHGGKNRSITLQITEMCLEPAPAKKAAATTLYGEDA